MSASTMAATRAARIAAMRARSHPALLSPRVMVSATRSPGQIAADRVLERIWCGDTTTGVLALPEPAWQAALASADAERVWA